MAHQRIIKSEFFTDEKVAELAPIARLFFIGLWTQADKNGVLEDRPKQLKTRCMPYDEFDAVAAIDELVARGFVVRYRVDNECLLQIRTWKKNQTTHSSERPGILKEASQATEIVALPLINRELPVSYPLATRQLPTFPSPVPYPFKRYAGPLDAASVLFESWRKKARKNGNTKLTETLRTKINAALKIWTQEQLELAIDAFVAEPWRKDKPGAQGLQYMFRDVNRFLNGAAKSRNEEFEMLEAT